jgi:adenosylhomocysteine nucleosidase|eukprot:m.125969 g.125969  ORF g.125969 m.125969 type:complete len:291 (-) comp22161_c0_seq1:1865-2737(-)
MASFEAPSCSTAAPSTLAVRGAPVVILCAVEEEAVHVRVGLDRGATEGVVRGTGLRKTTGTHCGVPVELIITNIGQSNAASAATAVILERVLRGATPPAAVFSCGCAGAHRENLAVGDVVIGTEVKAIGQVKVLPDGTIVPKGFRRTCQSAMIEGMQPASELMAAARHVASNRVADEGAPRSFLFGPVGSGDTWTCHSGQIRVLHQTFGTLCEEMEAAAVAQVCSDFRVPFMAVKDIANNELHLKTMACPSLRDVAPSKLDLPTIGLAAAEMTLATIRAWARATPSVSDT